MDVNVPTAMDNRQPFPILHVIPSLVEKHPNLSILIISMVADRVLINVLLESGARGYILKEENAVIEQLGSVVTAVAAGSNYVSDRVFNLLNQGSRSRAENPLTPRQLQALSLAAAHPEWSGVELARELGVTHSTTRNLLAGAYVRLGVNNLSAAVAKAEHLGLLTRRY
jgi:DNA-binding NarL/FixJ family response regulator